MAPRRWIELCTSSVFEKQRFNDFHEPRTRIIRNTLEVNLPYIVPGGKYLVTAGRGLSVWDLGCVSTVECKLVASVGLEDDLERLKVQATPDGKGLVILSYKR